MRIFPPLLLITLLASNAAAQQVRSGVLQAGDDLLPGRGYVDSYQIRAEAGRLLTVSLESSDFDAYLIVVDSNETQRWENDDFSGTDALLEIVPEEPTTYSVLVTSFARDGVGEYTLAWSLTDLNEAATLFWRSRPADPGTRSTEVQREALAEAVGETLGRSQRVPDPELRTRIEKARNERQIIVREARNHITKLVVASRSLDLSLSSLDAGMTMGLQSSPFIDVEFTNYYDKAAQYSELVPTISGLVGLGASFVLEDISLAEGAGGGIALGAVVGGVVKFLRGDKAQELADSVAASSIGQGLAGYQRMMQLLAFNRNVYSDVRQLDARLDSARAMDPDFERSIDYFVEAFPVFFTGSDTEIAQHPIYETFIDSVLVYSERFERRADVAEDVLTRARDMFSAYSTHPDYVEARDILGDPRTPGSVYTVAEGIKNGVEDFLKSYASAEEDWKDFRQVVTLSQGLRRRFAQFRAVGDLLAILDPT